MLRRLLLPAGFAVMLFAMQTLALENELAEDHELSMEFVTPHTDWAQPYALGKVRLLYFGFASYRRGTEARDVIELMQRFDLEAEAAWTGGEFAFPAGEERIAGLLELPWDCFLFNGAPLTQLPTEAQDSVLQAVSAGAGLVLVGLDDERVVKPENRVAALPPFLANDPVGDAYEVGAGRAIRLPARPHIEFRPGWEVDYDYWVERVGRAVLWAGDKSPRVNLSVALETQDVDRADLLEQSVRIGLEGIDAPARLKLEVRLRREDGAVFTLHPAPESPTTFPFVQRYRSGNYHVDAIARSAGGVEAWATVPLNVTASRTVTAINLDTDWGEIGGTIAGTVSLTGEPGAGETVRVQLLDARQRILTQADRPVTDSTARFEFPVEDWMPMLLEVRALVMDGDEEVSSSYVYFRVTKRSGGRFNFVVWDYPLDTLGPYVEQQLARLGCTVQIQLRLPKGRPDLNLAASNIAQIPYTTRILTSWDDNGYMTWEDKGVVTQVCWNDEPAIDDCVDSIVSKCERSRQHGVLAYSLGDETVTKGSCVHPACLDAYRRYLRQEYGDIAALNESWGSSYASFEQVNLLVEGDNDEAAALEQKIYPRWYDRHAFKGYNFVKLCERFNAAFRRIDPEARVGVEGTDRVFADGADIDLICRTNGFWSPYPGPADEVIRSIADRDMMRGNFVGYLKDVDSLLHTYWRMVTRGADCVLWWRWDGFGANARFRGLLASHLAPWPAIKELQRDTQIVRDGLGSVLRECRREDDRIAILHSYPSTFADKIEPGLSWGDPSQALFVCGEYETAHKAWQQTLRALGLQFSYVTDRMLRQGEFQHQRYKVLILPQTEAIGPREAEAIRKFVADGGTLIADMRPGIYDGHCRPLAQGILDDVFGIQRTGREEATSRDVTVNGKLGDSQLVLSVADLTVDPAVRPTSGQPMGAADTVPVCIVNETGRGRAVLLNFAMYFLPTRVRRFWPHYRDGKVFHPVEQETPAAAADFVAALLAGAGVQPEAAVTDLEGNPVRDTEVIRWDGAGVDFLALFGGFGCKDEIVQVRLPHARHVYDLREHVYRGRKATFRVHKLPSRTTFVALSDRRLSAPRAQLSSDSVTGGERLSLQLAYPDSPARYAARLRVFQPDGTHAEWFDQVVIVGPQGASAVLPIARNDPVGVWTIRATDLYTDLATRVRFQVQ